MLYFIINPIAGRGKSLRLFARLSAQLDARGVPYRFDYSNAVGHATELARAACASGNRKIIAVGGDGTVREIAKPMLGNPGVALGVVPAGSGNDFCRPLGITEQNALDTILAGTTRFLDAAQVCGEPFFNAMGLGFDVAVLQTLTKIQRVFRGSFGYVLSVLITLFTLRFKKVTIYFNGQVLEREILLAAIGNGSCFGGGMRVLPYADNGDGLLDLCVITRLPRVKIPFLLPKFIKGTHGQLKIVEFFQTRELRIETEAGLVQMDGALISPPSLDISVIPSAIEVLCPE